ncbi:MAG TPA: hypothetical protein VFA26_12035 [Gemmataceae bacterium]|nr:hypothetical protein [Gemmataceae bacterium]
MTLDDFEKTYMAFKYRKPPQPFVVELKDGRQVLITNPKGLVFNPPAVGYLSPQDGLVNFSCEEVRAFRALVPEKAP